MTVGVAYLHLKPRQVFVRDPLVPVPGAVKIVGHDVDPVQGSREPLEVEVLEVQVRTWLLSPVGTSDGTSDEKCWCWQKWQRLDERRMEGVSGTKGKKMMPPSLLFPG